MHLAQIIVIKIQNGNLAKCSKGPSGWTDDFQLLSDKKKLSLLKKVKKILCFYIRFANSHILPLSVFLTGLIFIHRIIKAGGGK